MSQSFAFQNCIEFLKDRFRTSLPGKKSHMALWPEYRDLLNNEKKSPVHSAVLLLIYPDKNNFANTVFIKRNSYKGYHSAEISLPGGKVDKEDLHYSYTAVRECNEEIGIIKDDIEILSALSDLYIPVSNFLIHPYVGYINYCPNFSPDKQEVDTIIKIDIHSLVNLKLKYFDKTFQNNLYSVPYFPLFEHQLWGATAMIVNEFRDLYKG